MIMIVNDHFLDVGGSFANKVQFKVCVNILHVISGLYKSNNLYELHKQLNSLRKNQNKYNTYS